MATKIEGISEEELFYMYKIKRMTLQAVADYYGVNYRTIWNIMEKYGISRRTAGESCRRDFGITKEELEMLYEVEGMTQHEISLYYGTNQTTIRDRMHKFNIKIRTRSEVKKKDFGITKEDIKRMYEEEKMTQQEISGFYNVGLTVVQSRMKEFGIKSRTISESNSFNFIPRTEEEQKDFLKKYARRYRLMDKGIIANSRYWQSDKGKEQARKKSATRRELGFIPLNNPFGGSEFHHINKVYGIYIPYEIHHSISHNVWTGEGMELINKEAFEFLDYELREAAWDNITGDWRDDDSNVIKMEVHKNVV